jgi:hypothetical protein
MPPAQVELANPPRTWISAALVYCLQKPGSAASAVDNPEMGNTDKTKATANGRLLTMKRRGG